MSVKRYSILDHPYEAAVMDDDPSGDYVKHSDYQSLAAENEGLRKALEHVRDLAMIPTQHMVALRYDIDRIAREALSRKAAP